MLFRTSFDQHAVMPYETQRALAAAYLKEHSQQGEEEELLVDILI